MSPSMYNLTVPVFVRGLSVLSKYMDMAQVLADEKRIDTATLIGARLAADMLPLSGQVQRASDNAKSGSYRLAGETAPSIADTETTFDELKARLSNTVALLLALDRAKFEEAYDRPLELSFQSVSGKMTGYVYLTQFLLPNFFFHISTAHGILRREGLQIGKKDYFGNRE